MRRMFESGMVLDSKLFQPMTDDELPEEMLKRHDFAYIYLDKNSAALCCDKCKKVMMLPTNVGYSDGIFIALSGRLESNPASVLAREANGDCPVSGRSKHLRDDRYRWHHA